jgi:hypothetical protein
MAGPDLFSFEDALARLGQNREQGCILVHKGAELFHFYVKDGYVIRAYSGTKEGDACLEQALHLANAGYTWLRGVQPAHTDKIIFLGIKDFIAKHTVVPKAKMIETVPQDKLMEKIYLTKTSTVLGRNETSDVVIDNSDVSSRHCILDIQTRGVFILDLDSTNGTFVNGTLVRDGYLNPGDRIELGPCVFVINREILVPL